MHFFFIKKAFENIAWKWRSFCIGLKGLRRDNANVSSLSRTRHTIFVLLCFVGIVVSVHWVYITIFHKVTSLAFGKSYDSTRIVALTLHKKIGLLSLSWNHDAFPPPCLNKEIEHEKWRGCAACYRLVIGIDTPYCSNYIKNCNANYLPYIIDLDITI